MAAPITELVFGPAPEAFRENPQDVSLVKPAYDILSKADGLIKAYYGIKHEDKATTYGIYVWETLEQHQAFMADKAVYPQLISAVSAIVDVPALTMVHVRTISDPYKVLEAPVVEIATYTLKEGQPSEARAQLEAFVYGLAKRAVAAPKEVGIVHATAGPLVENENAFLLMIGWTSVEAHMGFVKATSHLVEAIQKYRDMATISVIHVPLTLYQG